ncbi:MAG: peptidase MA domain-containing protein, partial [Dehalococcoidia bacterium]
MKKLIPLFLALFLLLIATLGPVQAQEGISALSTTEVQFPTELTFNLRAESAADITQIFLRYKVNRITTVPVTSVVQLEFDHAPLVEASWTWKMKKMLGSLPPGTEIRYSWRIQDASGYQLETAWETVQFNDNRYSWDTLTEGDVTLFWYRGGLSFAQALFDAANEALDRLARDTGAYLEQPIKIYIYASSQDLLEAMVYPQEWTGGVTLTEFNTVLIPVPPGDVARDGRTISHEMAHLVTYHMTFNPYNDIPTWLSEGLSTYAEGNLRPDFKASLDRAISEDSLIPLRTLSSNFPVNYDEAILSYGESYSVVQFLIDRYGSEKMLHLLSIFKQGSSYDDALLEAYGFDTAGLEELWRLSLGLEPRPSPSPPPPPPPPAPPRPGLFA